MPGATIPYRKSGPCTDCPWRTDVEPGQFEQHRFAQLKRTSEQPEVVSPADFLTQPMFACHQTQEGREQACAGWLVVAARTGNLRIRIALARRELPLEAVEPGAGWPPLFSSYEEMAAAQGRPDDGLGEIKPVRAPRPR
jgi:hypothetical protein